MPNAALTDPEENKIGPALHQGLVSVKLSTKSWLMIISVLQGWPLRGELENIRLWTATQILRTVLEDAGYTDDTES